MTDPGNGGRERRPRDEWHWPESSLLGGLPEAARSQLLAAGSQTRYSAGHVLMRQAERTGFVVILLDGVIKATGHGRDGREILLAVRMGGDLVGEFAGVDGSPRSATATACGPVAARVLSRADFLDCMRRDAQIALAVTESTVRKLRSANAFRVDFAGCDAATRVARVLYQIARAYGQRVGAGSVIRWPITQPELATLCGASEPTVHKTLRKLRESDIIATGYRTIKVEDLARLEAIALG